jgi:hypothetical protein
VESADKAFDRIDKVNSGTLDRGEIVQALSTISDLISNGSANFGPNYTILYYSLIRLIMETTYGFSQNASKAYYFVVFILPDYTKRSISTKVRTKHLQLDC